MQTAHLRSRHGSTGPCAGAPGGSHRKLLQKRLLQAAGAAREYQAWVALLGIDLDGFKQVNDVHGHHCGDLLLQQVGVRLRAALRESDTVARIGEDEFTLLLPRADEGAAIAVARRIHAALEQPFVVEGQRAHIGGSIGIAMFPEHADDIDGLIHRADAAMYLAKRRGGGYTLYSVEQEVMPPASHASELPSLSRRSRAPSTV